MTKKKILIFSLWLISILVAVIHFHENPEQIRLIKDFFKKSKNTEITDASSYEGEFYANAFKVSFKEVLKFDLNRNAYRTAFASYNDSNDKFDIKKIKIYFQNGLILKNGNYESIPVEKILTTDYNGGIKTILSYKNNQFTFMSSLKDDCYYASIFHLQTKKEIFKTKCISSEDIDFNGIGSSNAHYNDKILLSIGAPEWISSDISKLSQNIDSFYGKIIQIEKKELDKIILKEIDKISPKIFSMGHRNPQGLTVMNNSIFSVEHGPKGGDELNKIVLNKNYGWPISSYGIRYLEDTNKNRYKTSHENYGFEEPLFALVPSVGITSLNNCPKKIIDFYSKPCLLALSLRGNNLRPGRSIIIFLLNDDLTKVQSVEKILLGEELYLRDFVTNAKNEIYEDINGDIYLTVDGKGIYKLNFIGL